jgi:hypothetical protein
MGLGRASDLSLKEAREKTRKFRLLASHGIHPIEERRERRDQQRADALNRVTFKEAAKEFIALHSPAGKTRSIASSGAAASKPALTAH